MECPLQHRGELFLAQWQMIVVVHVVSLELRVCCWLRRLSDISWNLDNRPSLTLLLLSWNSCDPSCCYEYDVQLSLHLASCRYQCFIYTCVMVFTSLLKESQLYLNYFSCCIFISYVLDFKHSQFLPNYLHTSVHSLFRDQ